MFSPADLPDTLPLFPLPGAVILPRGQLPLHIFEPRYLAMLDDVLKTPHRLIGMIQPIHPSDDTPSPKLHQIGCAGRVVAFSELDDGRYMVTLRGISRFRVKGQISGFTPYLRADVSWQDFERDIGQPEHDPGLDRAHFMSLLRRYFSVEGLEADWESMEGAEEELLINSIAMLSPFEPEDKQALLEAPTLMERREILTALMEYALHRGKDTDDEVIQ